MEADPTNKLVSRCDLKKSGSRKRKSSYRSTENYSDCDVLLRNDDILENKKRRTSESSCRKKKHSGKSGHHSIATEPKTSCESTELDEHREMETRSTRSRGVGLKKIPPIRPCGVSDVTGIHDTHVNATSQYGSSQSSGLEILPGRSTYDSLSKHDEELVSRIFTKARKKRSSKLRLRGSIAETTVGDNNHGAIQLRTSSNGNYTHSTDAADPSKQNDVNQLANSNLYTDISADWEDFPLSNLCNSEITRIQQRRSR